MTQVNDLEDVLIRRSDEADQAWEKLSDQDPIPESWGMFSYGDAPGAIGGGFGAFVWFADRDQLLSFIESVLPFSPPGPCNRDPLAVEASVRAVISAQREGEVSADVAREQLNSVLRGFSQIEWWGTFKDLCGGTDAYAAKVIAAFREDCADEGVAARGGSVSRDELEEFKEFLTTYGL